MKYAQLLAHGKEQLTHTKKYMAWLKRKKPAKLDVTMQQLHNRAFEKIDCLQCANCCKTTSPIFYPKDVERAAKALRMKASAFEAAYLRVDEDGDYVLQQTPCPFLENSNECSIYESRPTACRTYPHTDRKDALQLTELTTTNSTVCPAVVSILEKLQQVYIMPAN